MRYAVVMKENLSRRSGYGDDDWFSWTTLQLKAYQEVLYDLQIFLDGDRAVAKCIKT